MSIWYEYFYQVKLEMWFRRNRERSFLYLDLVPTIVKSHGHCADEGLHPERKVVKILSQKVKMPSRKWRCWAKSEDTEPKSENAEPKKWATLPGGGLIVWRPEPPSHIFVVQNLNQWKYRSCILHIYGFCARKFFNITLSQRLTWTSNVKYFFMFLMIMTR